MFLKYIGPNPPKLINRFWGKEYLFAPPSLTCEVDDADAKVMLEDWHDLFQKVEKPEAETKAETVIKAPGPERPKVEPVRFFKRGRPRKNSDEQPKN